MIQGYHWHVLALSRKPLSREEIKVVSSKLTELPRSIGVPLETHIVAHSLVGRDAQIVQAESNQVFEAYGLSTSTPQALYLVRPDGYVAFRADRLDLAALSEFIRCLSAAKPVS